MLTKLIAIFTLFLAITSYTLFSPKQINLTSQKIPFCGLKNKQSENKALYISFYLDYITQRKFGDRIFECQAQEIHVLDTNAQDLKEGFIVNITEKTIYLSVSTYAGAVYGLQSIFSMIQDGQIPLGSFSDQPQVEFRGIMIDSVRHFLSVESIKRTIQAMSIVRLNMLHWHLSDDEAFTLTLKNHPQMIEGAYDKKSIYSLAQVQDIIAFAKKYAVNIIPEIDTPGHVRSWSQNSKHMGISILCGGGQGYNHQLDLSQDDVWQLAKDIVKEVAEIFKDSPYIHLGGDEVFASCWNRQPRIKEWMNNHSISTYGQLQMVWRKALISQIPDRKVIFWRNDDDAVFIQDNETLHYWGAQKDCNSITKNSKAKIIVSPSDYVYLNSGQGFVTGKPFGHYSTWRQIYQNWQLFPTDVPKSRILGALAALWGEVSNENMLDNNLWPRAAVVAHLAWSNEKEKLEYFVEGLLKVKKDLEAVGVAVSPFVSEYCENYPHQCKYTDNVKGQKLELKLIES